jgi:predicted nucleic acid-binding protein
MAIAAAENYRRLRKRGVTVRKSVDVLIATWCIENDVELLHADRDFDAMEPLGLKVVR